MPEIIVHINKGQIVNKRTVSEAFGDLPDGRYLVKIDPTKKRSLSQNAYYYGVCVPMVKQGLVEAGFDSIRTNDDAHQVMRSLFLKKHFVNPETGEGFEFIQSTAKLKTVEFNFFLEQIWKWAAEYLSIQIPLPNEQMDIPFFLAQPIPDQNAILITK